MPDPNNRIKRERFRIEYLSIGKGEKVLVCVSNIHERNSMCSDRCKPNLFKCQLYVYALSLTLFHCLKVSIIAAEKTRYLDRFVVRIRLRSPFSLHVRTCISFMVLCREITTMFQVHTCTRFTKFQCFLEHINPRDIIPIHYKPQKFYNDDQPVSSHGNSRRRG